MNDETPPPTDSGHDAAVEARIVSWVLGEASAFEAAELERLCEERPELLVFRRRMRELHGLLTDAEAAEPDLSWKLPAEKRRVLDEIFDKKKNTDLVPLSNEPSVRLNGRRALFAIAACVAISFFIIRLVPSKHEAEVVLELKPQGMGMTPFGGPARKSSSQKMTPRSFGTEFERIKSDKSLAAVVEKLDLTDRWDMDKESAVRRLKDSTVAENTRGTSLIKIKVRDANENDAKEIVREIAHNYRNYRLELETRESEKELAELNKEVRDQEDKVEENRKLLATISKTKGIIYRGQDSYYSQSAVGKNEATREESTTRGLAAQDYVDARREFESSQQLLESMKLKKIGAETTLKMSQESVVIHDEPELLASGNSASTDFQVPAPSLAKNSESSLMREARQQQLAKQSATPRGRVASAGASARVELPEIADSSQMESIRPQGDPLADSAGVGLGLELESSAGSLQKKATSGDDGFEDGLAVGYGYHDSVGGQVNPSYGVDFKNGLTSPAFRQKHTTAGDIGSSDEYALRSASADPFGDVPASESPADGELAIRTPGKKTDSASVPPVLSNKMPASPAAPESPPVLSDLAQREQIRRQGVVDAVLEDKPREKEPVRSDVTPDYDGNSEEGIRRNLYRAEGNYNLGKYDDAKKAYEDVLRADASNTAARQGLEKLAGARSDHYRAAYDHTRAELLTQTDDAWELSVPDDSISAGGGSEKDSDETSKLEAKKKRPVPAEPANLPDLMAEIPTSENPYSTFSLNISDASFQLAKASLAKGERPDPASIKPEQFYNAVDYGDPAPSANEPVAATIEQTAHPVIPGRNLVRVALRTGSVGRSAAQPLRLTLLVDQSGSMVREDRRVAMEQALAQLGTLLTQADQVTVIGFSRTPHLLAEGMTGDHAAKLSGLVNQTASEGGTNLEEAMKLGAELSTRHLLAGAQNRIVLFTDGAANLGDAKPERLAEQVKSLRQKGIAFDIAGIGADGLNDRLLSELARNGNGRYYVVGNEKNDSFARQLAGAFRPAAENVKIQVIFNPLRVGKYKLIGFEKDRLKTEDFRNDSVDAAELAADEAGVAIYQVEPLAEGSGEIGEISVRFRDTTSGEMVERGWTIPYDTKASAFDRATPSMQLAGLSMFAAEKLIGGPLATAIDFKQLSNSTAFVKQFYGSSPRVADMLQVIEALK